MKEQLGCWLQERLRTEAVLIGGRGSWLELCNRNERLEPDPLSEGKICCWADSSLLTVARMFPSVGDRLLQHCLREWPIRLAGQTPIQSPGGPPRVSFLIPVGGVDRLPQFRLSVASVQAQVDCAYEIIVVEHSPEPLYSSEVPSGVVYRHLKAEMPYPGYNRSAALNAGARLAQSDVLILLDADLLVPQLLARWVRDRFDRHPDLAATRFARMIFYLAEHDSCELSGPLRTPGRIARVVQNNPTPLAVRKEAYDLVGGHDEEFVGWGGEDTEFLSRLRTLKCSEGGRLPVVHAWHPPAPKKLSGHRNKELMLDTLRAAPAIRIAKLRACRAAADDRFETASRSPS